MRSTNWDIDVNESTQYNQHFIGLTFKSHRIEKKSYSKIKVGGEGGGARLIRNFDEQKKKKDCSYGN